jgi:hypothetical protein
MKEEIKDSVEVALDLDEKEVYSHIAHESAEDIIRIISSIDAERAKLRGEVIYYRDDWEDLIRERIAKGKRHTAFDFYNPMLFKIWEEKVKEAKEIKRRTLLGYSLLGILIGLSIVATVALSEPYFLLGVSIIPLFPFLREKELQKLDLVYYELTQFFIDELKNLLKKYSLPPQNYKFKIFSGDYFGISTAKYGESVFASVETENPLGKG